MQPNANITVYNRWYDRETRLDTWHATKITGAHWHGKQAVTVDSNGLNTADAYTVRIPLASAPAARKYAPPHEYARAGKAAVDGLWTLQAGDIIVRGLIDDVISKASDITAKYDDVIVATGVTDNRRGSPALQHWRVEGK